MIWDVSEAWEERYTHEWDHKDAECPSQPERMELAEQLAETDPAGALELYIQAAADGSVWSMWIVGWHHDGGCAVPRNDELAEQHYRIAINHGSMRANIDCAKLLKRQGRLDAALRILERPVEQGYVPALFWKAYYTYWRDSSRRTARRVEPLLVCAIDAGHPYARYFRSWLEMKGKLGLRQVRSGWRDWWQQLDEYRDACDGKGSGESPNPAA
ncbi:hypothetical protein [Qipengyuania sp.]|uniref:hypothetical protein n=1 Tax=Qipengyuania sp. TaxID=2004515 RepID=UPI003BAC13F5